MVVAINLFGNLSEEEEEECHDSLDLPSPGGDIGGGESFQYSGLHGGAGTIFFATLFLGRLGMKNPLLPSLAPAAMGAFRYSFLALYGINSVMCNYIRRHCIGITRTILYCALGQQNDCTFCPLVALRAYVYYLASKCTSTAHFFSLSPFPLKGLPTPILSPIFPSPPLPPPLYQRARSKRRGRQTKSAHNRLASQEPKTLARRT